MRRPKGIGEVEYHCGQIGPVKGKEKVRLDDRFCIDCSKADVEYDYPRSAWDG